MGVGDGLEQEILNKLKDESIAFNFLNEAFVFIFEKKDEFIEKLIKDFANKYPNIMEKYINNFNLEVSKEKFLEKLKQIGIDISKFKTGGDNMKENINNKVNANYENLIKVVTWLKNLNNLSKSAIEKNEIYIAQNPNIAGAYMALSFKIGHIPHSDLISAAENCDPDKSAKIAKKIIEIAGQIGASNLVRIAARGVYDDEEDDKIKYIERIMPDYERTPEKAFAKKYSQRLIPIYEDKDEIIFFDLATNKFFKSPVSASDESPKIELIVNNRKIEEIFNKIDANQLSDILSKIVGIKLDLRKAFEYSKLEPLVKRVHKNGFVTKYRFSPSEGVIYEDYINPETNEVVKRSWNFGLPNELLNLAEKNYSLKNKIANKIFSIIKDHFHNFKNWEKYKIEGESVLVYANPKLKQFVYFANNKYYKLDLNDLRLKEMSKGEVDEIKRYIKLKEPDFANYFIGKDAHYELIDSISIPNMTPSRFDIYRNPYNGNLKAKYSIGGLEVPPYLQKVVIEKYLNMPEYAKNNSVKVDNKKYLVNYNPKYSKFKSSIIVKDESGNIIKDKNIKDKILKELTNSKIFKDPDGKYLIVYSIYENKLKVFDENLNEIDDKELKKNILQSFYKNKAKEITLLGKKYKIYFDPNKNRYVVENENGMEIFDPRFKNYILRNVFSGKSSFKIRKILELPDSGLKFYINEYDGNIIVENIHGELRYPTMSEIQILKSKNLIDKDDYSKNFELSTRKTPQKYNRAMILEFIKEKADEIFKNVTYDEIEKILNNIFNIKMREYLKIDSSEIIDIIEQIGEKVIHEKDILKLSMDLADRIIEKEKGDLENDIIALLIKNHIDDIKKAVNMFIELIGYHEEISRDLDSILKEYEYELNKMFSASQEFLPGLLKDISETINKITFKSPISEENKQKWRMFAIALFFNNARPKVKKVIEDFMKDKDIEKAIYDKILSILQKEKIKIIKD